MQKIALATPHMSGNEMKYIKNAFDTNWIAPLGPNVDAFEKGISAYCGAKHAAALSSGTAAIHLALLCLGVKKGDVVFCSDLTFCASCNPIVYLGAVPVFIDSEKSSYNMDPVALKKAFEKYSPKAVVAVNLYGQSADMDKILEICNSHGVPVIEDAAESLGSTYKGKKSGTLGKIGVYSFNGNKIITTSGGGALVSDDKEIVSKARFYSTQAREKELFYQHKEIGYNYRMSNICAGIGLGQLEVLEERVGKKRYIYNFYKTELEKISGLKMMPLREYGESNCWLSVIEIDKSSKIKPFDLIEILKENDIETRPIWKPMHIQPVFENADYITAEGFSVSEEIFENGLCLPSDTKMSDEDLSRVCETIKKAFSEE